MFSVMVTDERTGRVETLTGHRLVIVVERDDADGSECDIHTAGIQETGTTCELLGDARSSLRREMQVPTTATRH
jgi:hypothetical protein